MVLVDVAEHRTETIAGSERLSTHLIQAVFDVGEEFDAGEIHTPGHTD